MYYTEKDGKYDKETGVSPKLNKFRSLFVVYMGEWLLLIRVEQ